MSSIRVRVRYSSILNYLAQMYRTLVAIAFAVVVARRLSVAEYGLWVTIMSIYGSFWAPTTVWRWWGSRFFARGVRGSAESVLALNTVYAPIMCLLLGITGYLYSIRIGWGFQYFLAIIIMVPLDVINLYLISMLSVTKPEAIGYSVIIYETSRLTYAFILVAIMKLALLGAVLSPILALATALTTYTLRVGIRCGIPLRPRVSRELVIKWFKGAYIPVIGSLNAFLMNLDKALLTAVTGVTKASAFLGVASIPRSVIIRAAGAISTSIYAKLLRSPSSRDVEDVIRIVLLIGIGELAIIVTLAKAVMSLLNPAYAVAPYLIIIMCIESFILMLGGVFGSVATGTERADVYEDPSRLTKTPLFKVPLVALVRTLVALGVATGLTTYLVITNSPIVKEPQLLALVYASSWLATAPAYLVNAYLWARRKMMFKFPLRELVAFSIAGLGASLVLVLLKANEVVVKHFWSDLPQLVTAFIASVATYLLISLALSPWLRKFLRTGVKYLESIVAPTEREGVIID